MCAFRNLCLYMYGVFNLLMCVCVRILIFGCLCVWGL